MDILEIFDKINEFTGKLSEIDFSVDSMTESCGNFGIPNNYGIGLYATEKGIIKRSKIKDRKEDGIQYYLIVDKKLTPVVLYPTKKIFVSNKIEMELSDLKNTKRMMDDECLTSLSKFKVFLQLFGKEDGWFDGNSDDVVLYHKLIARLSNELQLKMEKLNNKFGWNENKFSPYDCLVYLDDQVLKSLETAFCPIGNRNDWIEEVEKYRENNNFEAMFLTSLASPLLKPFNLIPWWLHASGKASTGKTAAMIVCESIYGDPKKIEVAFNITIPGLENRCNVLNNLPVFLNDSQMLNKHISPAADFPPPGEVRPAAGRRQPRQRRERGGRRDPATTRTSPASRSSARRRSRSTSTSARPSAASASRRSAARRTSSLVMPDADWDRVRSIVITSPFYGCAGQRCLAGSVVIAVGDAYEQGARAARSRPRKAHQGRRRPRSPASPWARSSRATHRDRILAYIEKGIEEGAKLVLDGRDVKVDGHENGNWIGPSLFDEVKPDMTIAQRGDLRPGAVASCGRRTSTRRSRHRQRASAVRNASSHLHLERQVRRASSRYRVAAAMVGVNIGVAAPMAYLPVRRREGQLLRRPQGPRPRLRRLLHRQEGRHQPLVVGGCVPFTAGEPSMPRKVTGGLIQCSNPINDEPKPVAADPGGDAREAPAAHRGGRQEGRADPRACRRSSTARTSARARTRAGTTRPRPCPARRRELIAAVREEVPDGDGRAGLRARAGRRLLQHRRGHRRRRHVPRQVPQEPHPAHVGFWEKYFFKPGQPRLPGVPDALRQDRRLHLLRPPLPRGRARCSA